MILFYAMLGFGLLLVKTSLLLPFPAVSRMFDPLLVLTVYLGLFRPGLIFAALAMFLGYLLDLYSSSVFGFHIIVLIAVYYVTSLLRGRFFLESAFFQGVYLAAMVLLHDVLSMGVFSLLGHGGTTSFMFDGLIARMIFNGVTGVYLFRWIRTRDARYAPLSERNAPGGISLN